MWSSRADNRRQFLLAAILSSARRGCGPGALRRRSGEHGKSRGSLRLETPLASGEKSPTASDVLAILPSSTPRKRIPSITCASLGVLYEAPATARCPSLRVSATTSSRDKTARDLASCSCHTFSRRSTGRLLQLCSSSLTILFAIVPYDSRTRFPSQVVRLWYSS